MKKRYSVMEMQLHDFEGSDSETELLLDIRNERHHHHHTTSRSTIDGNSQFVRNRRTQKNRKLGCLHVIGR